MKSKIWPILLVCGLVILIGMTVILTRSLFKTPIDVKKTVKIEQPANIQAKPLSDAVIEVGNDSAKTKNRPKVTQYSSGQTSVQKTGPVITEPIGKVSYLSGTASVIDQTGNASLLAIAQGIFKMDRIETGPNTKLELKFNDGTVISQGEKSSIIIEEYIFNSTAPEQCGFAMRFTRGVCRVITGLITDFNPSRFKVRAKMATIGIRGCDLVFKSTPTRDDIYVLNMARTKSIEIETTSDGSSLMDTNTGKAIAVDNTKKQQISITEPQTAVSVVNGRGPEQYNISTDENRDLISETSHMTPAHYELNQNANSATFKITPGKTTKKPTTPPSEERNLR